MIRLTFLFALLLLQVGCVTSTTQHTVTESDLKAVGNYAGLINYYKTALIASPNDPKVMLPLADAYYRNKDIESARFYVDQLEKLNYQGATFSFLAGNVYAASDDYSRALTAYQHAKQQGYSASDLDLEMGIVYSYTGQYLLAKEAFDQARLKGHDDIAIKNNLAVLAIAQAHYQQAVDILLPVFQHSPEQQKVSFNLAIALIQLGDIPQAKQVLGERITDDQLMALVYALRVSGNTENKENHEISNEEQHEPA